MKFLRIASTFAVSLATEVIFTCILAACYRSRWWYLHFTYDIIVAVIAAVAAYRFIHLPAVPCSQAAFALIESPFSLGLSILSSAWKLPLIFVNFHVLEDDTSDGFKIITPEFVYSSLGWFVVVLANEQFVLCFRYESSEHAQRLVSSLAGDAVVYVIDAGLMYQSGLNLSSQDSPLAHSILAFSLLTLHLQKSVVSTVYAQELVKVNPAYAHNLNESSWFRLRLLPTRLFEGLHGFSESVNIFSNTSFLVLRTLLLTQEALQAIPSTGLLLMKNATYIVKSLLILYKHHIDTAKKAAGARDGQEAPLELAAGSESQMAQMLR